MTDRVAVGDIAVARSLYDFVNEEALPGTGVAPEKFWTGFDAIVRDLAPKNRALLEKRDRLQAEIDAWHRDRRGKNFDLAEYKAFLQRIGYLLPEGPDFSIATTNVDPEIADVAGPQLVVPVMNARYALNAANARWGSLYDALYGTDAIPEDGGAERGKGYNPVRGKRVIDFARGVLDEAAPLGGASWRDATGISVKDGALSVATKSWRGRPEGGFALRRLRRCGGDAERRASQAPRPAS